MPIEDAFSHLSADTAHRFRAVAEALLALGRSLPEMPRLLDVGGYPGTFAREFTGAFPRWKGTTLDRPEEDLPDYVSGAGERLPFGDGSFDVTTSIDTFEHIHPDGRAAFLSELGRVSSHAVVLACPVRHASTEMVEKMLNQAHKESFGAPHPWLYEHVQYGLPSIGDIFGAWPRSHGIVEARGSYDLRAWVTWHGMWLLRRLRGELDNAWNAFDSASAAAAIPPVIEIPYRIVVVAVAGAPIMEIPRLCSDLDGQAAVELARLFVRMLDVESREQQSVGAGGGPVVVEQRLKDALLAGEKRIEELQTEFSRLAQRPRGLRGLFRR